MNVSLHLSTMELAVAALVAVFRILGTWMMLRKMDESGWKALIPFYGEYLLFKHTWHGGMYFALLGTSAAALIAHNVAGAAFSPVLAIALAAGIAAFLIQVKASNKLSKAFGHGVGYTLGLLFLEPIFYMILGFSGKDTFHGVQAA